MALCCCDTAHGTTCVLELVQKNGIAVQMVAEWLPKAFDVHRDSAGGNLRCGQIFRAIGFDFWDSDFYWALGCRALLSCPSHLTCFFVRLHMVPRGARWVQVCSVQPLYCTGGDHHKAQTGGVIWPSLKLSPGDYNVEVGRNLGAPLWWMSPGSGQGTTTMDRALNAPPIEEMDEWPLIIHRKTHSCIHTDKYLPKSYKHPSMHNWDLILSSLIGYCVLLEIIRNKQTKVLFFVFFLFDTPPKSSPPHISV